MQGKFQMVIMGNCGHTMQEDAPDQTANKLLNFVLRVMGTGGMASSMPDRPDRRSGREGGPAVATTEAAGFATKAPWSR
jgi:hypothetical protein